MNRGPPQSIVFNCKPWSEINEEFMKHANWIYIDEQMNRSNIGHVFRAAAQLHRGEVKEVSQGSSVSSTSLCQAMRQLAVTAPLSSGGTSCSLVCWLSTGCSFSFPASRGIYMAPAELKWWLLFFCRETTIFIHPSVITTGCGSKHARNSSYTSRRSRFISYHRFFFNARYLSSKWIQ